MKPHPMSAHRHPITVAAVVGSFALAVVVLLRVLGIFGGSDTGLRNWYVGRGFSVPEGSVQPGWDFLLALVAVYGLVWFLFEIPGTGRRILVLVTALVLLGVGSPVLALWGVFWSPVGAMLGLAWGGFCAIHWARHHPMPCDLPTPRVELPEQGKIVPLTRGSRDEEGQKKKSKPGRSGKSGRGNH